MKKKTVIEIDMQELRKLIRDTFKGKAKKLGDFNFVAIEEWNNDEQHSFNIDASERDEWEENNFQGFLSGDWSRQKPGITLILLNELAARKVIPEGEYLLNISW